MKKHFLLGVLSSLAFATISLGAWANNCTTCNGANEGKICYATDDKVPYYCNGTAWASMSSSTGTIYSFAQTPPTVGTNGGSTVTLCNVAPGAACGGGIYAGDGNLIAAPGGCTGTPASPSCPAIGAQTVDALTLPWDSSTSVSLTNHGAGRYGYDRSLEMNASRYAAAYYCNNLNYGGYTDWYLPKDYEMMVLGTNSYEIGYFAGDMTSLTYTQIQDEAWGMNNNNKNYWTATEQGGSGGSYDVKVYATFVNWAWPSGTRTENKYLRCVRRN